MADIEELRKRAVNEANPAIRRQYYLQVAEAEEAARAELAKADKPAVDKAYGNNTAARVYGFPEDGATAGANGDDSLTALTAINVSIFELWKKLRDWKNSNDNGDLSEEERNHLQRIHFDASRIMDLAGGAGVEEAEMLPEEDAARLMQEAEEDGAFGHDGSRRKAAPAPLRKRRQTGEEKK